MSLKITSLEDILDVLNDMEKKFPVDKWNAAGFDIWPLLRIEIYTYLIYKYFFVESASKVSSKTYFSTAFQFIKRVAAGIKRPYYSIWKDRENTDKIEQRDVFFLGESSSYVNMMGRYYERFSDPFQEVFTKKNISSIRLDIFHIYPIRRFSPSVYIQTNLDWTIIKNLVFRKTTPINLLELSEFDAFNAFCREHEINIPSLNALYFSKRVHKIEALQSYFEKILTQIQPKLVGITCYYSDCGIALIQLCRRLGISTMDIQHGVAGDLHPAYGRWHSVPKEGYNTLPNYFWNWGETEAASINNWSNHLTIHKPLPGGNLLLRVLADDSSSLVQRLDKQIDRVLSASKQYQENTKNILFTLQWDTIEDAFLEPLFEAMRKIENNYNWWLRLHPVMLSQREEIRALFIKKGIKNFELDFPTDLPLYSVLRKTDLHITHSSSVVIEAAEYGIPSIVISQYGSQFFTDYLEKGTAHIALDSASLIESIQKITSSPSTKKLKAVKVDDLPEFTYLENLIKSKKNKHFDAQKA